MIKIEEIHEVKELLSTIPNVQYVTIGGSYLQELYNETTTEDIDILVILYDTTETSIIKSKIIEIMVNHGLTHNHRIEHPLRFMMDGHPYLDIFINRITEFSISAGMRHRIRNGRLSFEDYIFTKLQTTREGEKDKDDVRFLLRKERTQINWKVFLEEVQAQFLDLGEKLPDEEVRKRFLDFAIKLEQINEDEPQLIPRYVLNGLEEIYNLI